MPIFPYDDEEERRRRLGAGQPFDLMGELDAARRPAVLPEISTASPGMLSSAAPGALPPPTINRQSRFGEMQEARDAYLEKTPGRGRSALTGALQSFLGGGGLAGAAFGAARGAIDPRGQREEEFNRKIRPQIAERFAFEDADRAAQRQAGEDEVNAAYKTAQIGALNRSNQPPPPRQPSFGNAPGLGIFNEQTGQVTTPAPAPQPRELAPRPVINDRGEYVDFNAETKAGRKVKAFQKPKASGGGGGGGGSSSKDMRAANVEMRMFQRLKGEADRANREGDTEIFAAKMAELQDAADRIDALYGNTVEVGESEGWPYVKFRQGGKGRQAPQKQAQPASRKDPLGIR